MIEEPDVAAVEEFGPYLVYERLGVGGMATVHRALERGIEGFERIVALKRLLPHLAEDASFIKSFVREAKLASTLQHANIVQTLELGRVGGSYFISMEYIDGRDVRKILRHARRVSGPPPINVTLALMLQLCDALDYAHNRTDSDDNPLGIVHRDLSPSNLLLTRSGHLKVIDFGIAKAQAAHLATQTGRVKGKLAYMAPESIAGKELDSRSDLFAAGVVFHELLTARPLFAQKNEYQTLLKVQRGEVAPPSTFNEGVPKELDDIVLRALSRDPEDRWPTAAALRDALVTVRMARQLSATPRDVTTWCDWAFALEVGGFSGKTSTEAFSSGLVSASLAFGGTKSPIAAAHRTPRPRPDSQHGPDEDAAAEIAWGAPEIDAGVAHLHDDVPDVSAKFSVPVAAAASSSASITTPGGNGAGISASSIAAAAAAAAEVAIDESHTDEHPAFNAAMLDASSAATTQPDMAVSTIKTLAVPPPGSKSEVRPAAFPAGSSNDALRKARPRTITIPPKPGALPVTATAPTVTAAGTQPPAARKPGSSTIPGLAPRPAPASKPPPIPTRNTARGSTVNLLTDLDSADGPPPTPAHMTAPRRAVTIEAPTIGASIAARPTHGPRTAIIGLIVLGAAATAVTLAVTMGDDEVAAVKPRPTIEPLPRTNGTVKFVIEPADSTIKLSSGEPHIGSPWATQLPPGLHQVEIHRDGYKSWLTSIELSGGETQTLRVVLEQVGGNTAASATLVVDPSVDGLEVMLDGELLPDRTPVKLDIKPGPHRVALRENGVEVWAEDFTAVANSTQAFDPSMSDDKKRERRHRHDRIADSDEATTTSRRGGTRLDSSTTTTRPDPTSTTMPAATVKPPTPVPVPTPTQLPTPGAGTTPKPAGPTVPGTTTSTTTMPATNPPIPTPVKPEPVKPTPVKPEPVKPTPAPQPAKTGPEIIPPGAVSRTSGAVPSLKSGSSLASERIPANISAKVCIDTGGGVSSASVLTRVPDDVKKKLEIAIRAWRYTPYKKNGTAMSACFVASFRSK